MLLSPKDLSLTLVRDWKKLTFYYFADSYINFNPLVTDLFKIYKTRIWMSAISPLCLPAPSSGPQLPIGQGPGAFTSDMDSYPGQQGRGPSDFTTFNESHLVQPRVVRGVDSARENTGGILERGQIYGQTFRPPNLGSRSIEQLSLNYSPIGQEMLPATAQFSQPPYNSMPAPQLPYTFSGGETNGQRQIHNGQQEWPHPLHGLSLGP